MRPNRSIFLAIIISLCCYTFLRLIFTLSTQNNNNNEYFSKNHPKSSKNTWLPPIDKGNIEQISSHIQILPSEIPICPKLIKGQLSNEEKEVLNLKKLERQADFSKNGRSRNVGNRRPEEDLFDDLSFGNYLSYHDYEKYFTNQKFNSSSQSSNSKNKCSDYKSNRQFIQQPLSSEESNYPIAYSIVIHKDIQLFERLLRSIYHPQNFYCIHVDQKTSPAFQKVISNIISCFDNVFHPRKQEKVYYLHYSRVQADLNCLEEFQNRGIEYKYVFNLCGQDFPLKTNFQLVRDLKGLYGFNEIESVDIEKTGKLNRILKGYDLNPEILSNPDFKFAQSNVIIRNPRKDKKPDNLHYAPSLGPETGLFAGSAYFLFSKQAVDFILSDKNVKQYLEWSKDSWSPDESIWATLSRYHRLPGSYSSHSKFEFNEVHTRTRLVKWAGLDRVGDHSGYVFNNNQQVVKKVPMYETCHGSWLRGVCVFGALDLPWLIGSRHWFGNKFDPKVDSVAIDCLDVFLRNKALADVLEP